MKDNNCCSSNAGALDKRDYETFVDLYYQTALGADSSKQRVIERFIRFEPRTPVLGWEPWSSGYVRRLTSKRSWVQIPAPGTGWSLFHIYCYKNCNACLKRPKIKTIKEANAPFLKNKV